MSVSYRTYFYRTVRTKKIARVSYRTDKFFFFDGKMLQRQNVLETIRVGNRRSGHENVDTKIF